MKSLKNRRAFLRSSLLASAAIPFLQWPLISCNSSPKNQEDSTKPETKKLNILILGGTSFLGPHQIAYAMERGHKITTFTRGKTIPEIHSELFENVEKLIGDREDDLEALKNRKWDAVIDNSGRKVAWTQATAALLNDNVGLYVYTSSTSVFFPYLVPEAKEDMPVVLEMPEKLDFEYERGVYEYGIMKANSELAAQKEFGKDRTIVVRPTYMVGPGDRTDRFMYWPERLNAEGEMVIPGKYDDQVQFVDIRDVASWMIRLVESKTAGTFNAVGPENKTGLHEFVNNAHSAYNSKASLVMVDDYDFLQKQNIHYMVPWIMPIGNEKCSSMISNELAKENGLTFRDFNKTMRDTYNWWTSEALKERRDKFMKNPRNLLNRESEVIKAWKDHVKT